MLRNLGLIELCNLYSSSSITIMITSRKSRYRRQIAHTWEMICMIYEKSYLENPNRKHHLGQLGIIEVIILNLTL